MADRRGSLGRPSRAAIRGVAAALLALAGASAAAPAQPISVSTPLPTLQQPNGLAEDRDGSLLITDVATHRLFRLRPGAAAGKLEWLAGSGFTGPLGDGGPATRARLNFPSDVAVAPDGSILLADSNHHRIRKIDRRGIIQTMAGTGREGRSGDGGPALKGMFSNPQGIALGPDGTLYIADTFNHRIRRVDPQGVLTTVAGTEAGLAGDGGPASRAQISLPMGVTLGPDGSIWIAEAGNNRIRRILPDGTIRTEMGFGPGSGTAGAGFSGDGGPPSKARLFAPADVEWDTMNGLWISDTGNQRLRRALGGVVASFPATNGGQELQSPQKLVVTREGAVLVADRMGGRILRFTPDGGMTAVWSRKP